MKGKDKVVGKKFHIDVPCRRKRGKVQWMKKFEVGIDKQLIINTHFYYAGQS